MGWQDLFYRLNVIRVQLPPLRERMEDVPMLAQHFLNKHSALEGKRLSLSSEAMSWIVQQRFPGNVRELENVIERAVALASEPFVVRSDLTGGEDSAEQPSAQPVLPAEGVDLDAQLGALERSMLVQALERTGGNRTNAAKLLRMTLRSLRYRLAKYELGEESGSSGYDDAEEA